jgi:hypothetical protein
MRLSILCVYLFPLLTMSILPALAEDSPAIGLNALPEVEFSQLSQRDPNPLGEKALAIHPAQWKHGETDHFIYHFVHSYVATRVSVEAEFHYRVVAKELEREQPAGDTKSHIYIFERPEEWQQFQAFGKLEPWTGGIHSQGSLFIPRNRAYKFPSNLLGHEIVHLVMHRFYSGGIPCWLDEGFAQYISKAAHASYQRTRGYIAKPHSSAIASQDLSPHLTLRHHLFAFRSRRNLLQRIRATRPFSRRDGPAKLSRSPGCVSATSTLRSGLCSHLRRKVREHSRSRREISRLRRERFRNYFATSRQ